MTNTKMPRWTWQVLSLRRTGVSMVQVGDGLGAGQTKGSTLPPRKMLPGGLGMYSVEHLPSIRETLGSKHMRLHGRWKGHLLSWDPKNIKNGGCQENSKAKPFQEEETSPCDNSSGGQHFCSSFWLLGSSFLTALTADVSKHYEHKQNIKNGKIFYYP